MKRFSAIFIATLVLIGAVFVSANIIVNNSTASASKQYRVEANRISADISNSGYESLDLSKYPTIVSVTKQGGEEFYKSDYDYLIINAGGTLYRIDYIKNYNNTTAVVVLNLALLFFTLIIVAVFLYVRQRILKPFNTLSEIPYELSKGNLTIPIKEEKGRYFGRFLWGTNLLREHLESQKNKELYLQKEKQTLLLSISHDIKTPLGVIELYSKALEKNLYKNEAKQKEIACNITNKCDEIRGYISQLVNASSEDFINFDVEINEVYLSSVIDAVKAFYKEKLSLLKINFMVADYTDCLIFADVDRGIEVFQNIIENAIKYGDGNDVNIEFSQEDGCALVTVANSGCTLSENELPHIFDSFWRGSNTGSKGGSGLGLYICRKLMHAMNGEIFAKVSNGYMYVTTVFPMV